jgi:deazaflavin-dependent oxidoreductase (nitroreductase family)
MDNETPAEAAGWVAHLKAYRENPDQGHDWDAYGKPVTALLLIVKGRTSGKLRTRPLIYRKVGRNYILVGSKGGSPDHPFWYKNLLANPEAEIQVRREHIKVRARTAQGAEREALWAQMADLLPQFEDYKARTDRELPVVVLEPQDS